MSKKLKMSREILIEIKDELFIKLENDAQEHYSTFIFAPDYPGQDYVSKFAKNQTGHGVVYLIDQIEKVLMKL